MKSQKDSGAATMPSLAAERAELEAVLASGIFVATSNAARLLRFVCEKSFEDPAAALVEYDIAVHALGRRPDFDSRQDSIVRVEAHRVRKRLKEYYEAEGDSHPVRIVLPPGQYTPQFVQSDGPAARLEARPARWRAIAALAGIILAGGLLLLFFATRKMAPPVPSRQTGVPGDPVAAPAGNTVRILAGVLSSDHVDRAGNRWTADAWFTGGTATTIRYYSLAMADDPAIYEHCRTGEDFSYDIPLRPGYYEMRLMFAESAEAAPVLGAVGDGSRVFGVLANGVQVLPPVDGRHLRQLDILADAGGTNIANVKVLKDITPAVDGKLHLRFVSRKQKALLNAIEIVPGIKGKMWPLRWRAGETPYVDQSGKVWLADRYFRGGRLSRFHSVVTQTPDPNLYEGERFGHFTYEVPVVAGSSYTVTMKFAENFFGTWSAPLSPPRMFNVYANRVPLLHDFDIYREAGGPLRAVNRTFHGIKPNVFDKIELDFEPITDYPVLNAIEVEDESR